MKPNFTFESLGGSLRDARLAEASLRRYAASGTKVYCEPVIRAAVTDPVGFNLNLAGHGVVRAFYIRNDDRFDMWFSFQATSGFNPGSGVWSMELPDGVEVATVATSTMYADLGTWHVHRPSSNAYVEGRIEVVTATAVRFSYVGAGAKALLSDASPWAFSANDRFGGHISLAVS